MRTTVCPTSNRGLTRSGPQRITRTTRIDALSDISATAVTMRLRSTRSALRCSGGGGSTLLTTVAAAAQDPFAKCAEQFAQKPDDYESAYCFYQVTFEKSLWEDGARLFDGLIAKYPENLWLPLAYGHVYRSRDPKRPRRFTASQPTGFSARVTSKARSWREATCATSSSRRVASRMRPAKPPGRRARPLLE